MKTKKKKTYISKHILGQEGNWRVFFIYFFFVENYYKLLNPFWKWRRGNAWGQAPLPRVRSRVDSYFFFVFFKSRGYSSGSFFKKKKNPIRAPPGM